MSTDTYTIHQTEDRTVVEQLLERDNSFRGWVYAACLGLLGIGLTFACGVHAELQVTHHESLQFLPFTVLYGGLLFPLFDRRPAYSMLACLAVVAIVFFAPAVAGFTDLIPRRFNEHFTGLLLVSVATGLVASVSSSAWLKPNSNGCRSRTTTWTTISIATVGLSLVLNNIGRQEHPRPTVDPITTSPHFISRDAIVLGFPFETRTDRQQTLWSRNSSEMYPHQFSATWISGRIPKVIANSLIAFVLVGCVYWLFRPLSFARLLSLKFIDLPKEIPRDTTHTIRGYVYAFSLVVLATGFASALQIMGTFESVQDWPWRYAPLLPLIGACWLPRFDRRITFFWISTVSIGLGCSTFLPFVKCLEFSPIPQPIEWDMKSLSLITMLFAGLGLVLGSPAERHHTSRQLPRKSAIATWTFFALGLVCIVCGQVDYWCYVENPIVSNHRDMTIYFGWPFKIYSYTTMVSPGQNVNEALQLKLEQFNWAHLTYNILIAGGALVSLIVFQRWALKSATAHACQAGPCPTGHFA